MRIDVLTLFPEMFESPLSHSIITLAKEAGIVDIVLTNIRDSSKDKHKKVDDRPYGGGPGMVMLVEPLAQAINAAKAAQATNGIVKSCVIHLSPQGRPLTHAVVKELQGRDEGLILLASRYEGVDERLIRQYVDEELSIGDYVLSGGELAAMVL